MQSDYDDWLVQMGEVEEHPLCALPDHRYAEDMTFIFAVDPKDASVMSSVIIIEGDDVYLEEMMWDGSKKRTKQEGTQTGQGEKDRPLGMA